MTYLGFSPLSPFAGFENLAKLPNFLSLGFLSSVSWGVLDINCGIPGDRKELAVGFFISWQFLQERLEMKLAVHWMILQRSLSKWKMNMASCPRCSEHSQRKAGFFGNFYWVIWQVLLYSSFDCSYPFQTILWTLPNRSQTWSGFYSHLKQQDVFLFLFPQLGYLFFSQCLKH